MKLIQKAYIAGFLDADGSIHVRIKPNSSYRFDFQIAPSIVFYQSKKECRGIEYIQNLLKVGYIRERKDGIVEYIIGSTNDILNVIQETLPYLVLKKDQAILMRKIILQKKSIKNENEFYLLCKEIDRFEELNYSKTRKISSVIVRNHFLSKNLMTP